MAVKYETACLPTDALIAKQPRRHYLTRVRPIHWQLRSIIGVSQANTVYHPAGSQTRLVQEFNTVTQRSETIASLSFSPRSLVVRKGWMCCGGDEGEFVAIRLNARGAESNQSPAPGAIGSGSGTGTGTGTGSGGRSHGRNSRSAAADSDGDRDPSMDDEEYDDFDLRLSEAAPAQATVPSRLIAKCQKFGVQRVNCITVWTPPTFVPLYPGAYQRPVAVLANNDMHVTVVDLESTEGLDVLEYPDCVNRAVISPDGRLLVAVCDDPYLYIHERVENPEPAESGPRLSRFGAAPGPRAAPRKPYEWKLLARHYLRGQNKDDRTSRRGSFAACFSNTGRYLAVGTQHGVILIFETCTLADPSASLVACFTSSNPNLESGAVREMSFCPGPFDLLAWSENYGAVGIADVRSGFVSRQILGLCENNDYEHIAVDEIIHTSDDLGEERRRRRRHRGTSADNMMRDVLADTSPPANDYDMSSGEQALRVRNALDRYHMPFTADETQFLGALQERRRQREREHRDQQTPQQGTREQRERDRERIQEYLGRRSAWLLRSRPSLGSRSATGNNNNNSNNSGGGGAGAGDSANTSNTGIAGSGGSRSSSSMARSLERNQNVSMAVDDILGSLRNLRNAGDVADLERRWLARAAPSGPLQAGSRQAGASMAGVENEESDSDNDDDDDGFPSSRTLTQAASVTRRRQPWGTMDPSPLAYGSGGGDGAGEGGSSSRTMDLLNAYTFGEPAATPGRGSGGGGGGGGGLNRFGTGTRRTDRTALPESFLGQTGLLDLETGVGAPTARRRRESETPVPVDGQTAGLAWSEDGSTLYIGAENGIFEFRVNIKSRMFYPSVTMR